MNRRAKGPNAPVLSSLAVFEFSGISFHRIDPQLKQLAPADVGVGRHDGQVHDQLPH